MTGQTSDGYVWTPASGVSKGSLTCAGVIEPSQRLSTQNVYDCIIIGAGFAGLTAARDLALAGKKVLLIEARDRIGGRTYSVNLDGYTYEMGGTWVSHFQGNLFREMQRYGKDRDLVTTRQGSYENNYYTMDVPGSVARKLSHEEAGQLTARAWDMFVDIDGAGARKICPLPHQQLGNVLVKREDVERWDQLSCQDRYDQIKHRLTAEESGLLLSLILHISGGNLENSSLWDMIRSHALAAHSSDNFEDVWLLFKLREGQSTLARAMFDEAVGEGADYAFSTEITTLKDNGKSVDVVTTKGKTFRASKVISTVPLNVLRHLKFDPPLSRLRAEAAGIGHVNFMNKIHIEAAGPGLASWNGMAYPNLYLYGYGDGVLPSGNAHLVAFGAEEKGYVIEDHPQRTVQSLQKLHEMDVKRLVFHNWNTDPYAQGGPAWWSPSYMSKYQDELQSPHGNIHFASADWAHGWRAFIDGAIEQGALNAKDVLCQLKSRRSLNDLRL